MPNCENKKILFIEDDVTQSMMYRLAFENGGYRILTAAKGREGFETAKKEQPDLIFLDIILGDFNGLEVLKLLKKDEKTKGLKVVILSNLNKREIVQETLELGALDYLVKLHFLPKEVVAKAENYLGT